MKILGVSGLEDRSVRTGQSLHAAAARTVEDLLTFSGPSIPLQFLPLGLLGHDSSAALVSDEGVVAFAAEERFSRVKHGYNLAGRTVLPRRAIAFCLQQADTSWANVDYIAHYCHFTEEAVNRRLSRVARNLSSDLGQRLAEEYAEAYRQRLSKEVIFSQFERLAGRRIAEDRLVQVQHHLAHAAGAFYSSDLAESLVLAVDGYGEEESSLWAIGQGSRIYPLGRIPLPTSLGLLYQIFTAYLGFRSFGDEYKVMGLSSYGNPKAFPGVFRQFIEQDSDGTYRMEKLSSPGLASWLRSHFGPPFRDERLTRRKADMAASLQKALEETLLDQLSALKTRHGQKNLCLSGGVGLNARANGALLRSRLFKKVFIQPAAGDDGASLGAALYVRHEVLQSGRGGPVWHVFWGPDYTAVDIERALGDYPRVKWRKCHRIEEVAARMIEEGKIVGWFQGRMEMGPRALGARSILADPRAPELRDKINARIKRREGFRPFAPSILEEEASHYFDIPTGTRSPFMLVIYNTRKGKRARIPAVIHVDGTARLQTVGPADNPRFYRLIRCFFRRTGLPLLLNTSFNMAGEPIVNSPRDALNCFLKSGLDGLVIEDYLVLNR